MSFLFPQAFFLAALLPAIVLLYLHRSKRRTSEVSSLLFWQRVMDRAPQRRFLGSLRNPLSLLLQLLIFLLLLFALARPEFGSGAVRRSTVVVLDARARMQAEGGVFSKAINEAQAIAAGAGPDAEVAVLAVEGGPRIVSSFSSDAKELRSALAALSPSDAGDGLEESVELARRLLKARPGQGRLIVISDRPSRAEGVEEILVGAPTENLGILSFAVNPLPASPQSVELFLKVGNFSSKAREVEVEFSLDDRVFDLRKQPVAAGGEADFTIFLPSEVLQSKRGFLGAKIIGADALAADDNARAVIPTGGRVRVLLVSEGNPFLEKALASDPGVALEILQPGQWRDTLGEGFDALVFDEWMPEGTTLESTQARAIFFYGKSPLQTSGPTLDSGSFEVTAPQNPLLWNINLQSARLARLRPLARPKEGPWRVEVPVESSGEPAMVALEHPDGRRVVATAFGTADSNLALRTAFPLLVSNIVHWLAKEDRSGTAGWSAGQTFHPASGESLNREPDQALAAKAPSLTEAPHKLRKNGFYEVRGSEGSRWIAVNTADALESDVRESRGQMSLLADSGLRWPVLRPWQWLALAALALMLLEWRWHHRRITE